MLSRLVRTALTGSRIEPVNRNSRISVPTAMIAIADGRWSVMVFW
jgi:hypothetical protein